MHLRGDKCAARAKGRYQKPGSGGGHECTCVQRWGVAAGGVYSTHCVHTLVTPSPLIPLPDREVMPGYFQYSFGLFSSIPTLITYQKIVNLHKSSVCTAVQSGHPYPRPWLHPRPN